MSIGVMDYIRQMIDANGFIPAITLWQPWASLLACEAKQFETRSWPTKYRGPIAIHAAKKDIDSVGLVFGNGFWDAAADALNNPELLRLPRGAVIATAELIGCYPMEIDAESGCVCITTPAHGREMPSAQEYLFGDWQPNRYAWEFANVQLLSEPIPAKGKQGLWKWKGESA